MRKHFRFRAVKMLYQGLKQNSTIVIVPSTAVESMQLGGLAGLTPLPIGIGQDKEAAKAAPPISTPVGLNGVAYADEALTVTKAEI